VRLDVLNIDINLIGEQPMTRSNPVFAFALAFAAVVGLWTPTLAPVEARPAAAVMVPALA
jgi:hypothetical protein